MQAGLLNEIIEIHRQESRKSKFGDEQFEWMFYDKTKAEVSNLSGNRNTENHQIVYDYTKKFVVRYYIDVKDTDRILYDGDMYRILNIDANKKLMMKTISAEIIHE